MQERGRRGQATAALRSAGGAFELDGNLLVGSGRRSGHMPCATVRVDISIGGLCQRPVGGPALLDGGCAIYRGAHQRMPEHHPLVDGQQAIGLGGAGGGGVDAQPLSGAPEQERISYRLGSREQQQPSRVVGQRRHPSDEALLDPGRQRHRGGQREPAGQLCRSDAMWQLQQRQGVAARLSDDSVTHPVVPHRPHRGAEESAGVVVAQAPHLEIGQVLELITRLARREHDPDRLRQQPTGDECQSQRGGPVEPLRIVDHAEQRPLLGRLREQAQHRQPHEEAVRRCTRAQAEHDVQGLALRPGKSLEPVKHRGAQLMEAGVRQLHL